jgi:hypothetical protein
MTIKDNKRTAQTREKTDNYTITDHLPTTPTGTLAEGNKDMIWY